MSREYQNGDGFGYLLSFRRQGGSGWQTARVPGADAQHFVYSNDSVRPYTPFEVKIRSYNRRGEGPESLTALVYSAEEGGPPVLGCVGQGAAHTPAQFHVRVGSTGRDKGASGLIPWLPCLPTGLGEGEGSSMGRGVAWGRLWEPPGDLLPGPWVLRNPKQGQAPVGSFSAGHGEALGNPNPFCIGPQSPGWPLPRSGPRGSPPQR